MTDEELKIVCREDILKLIAEVRRLREELAQAKQYSTTDWVIWARKEERERCAKFAESVEAEYGLYRGVCLDVAAGIRAMKDEP